MFYITHFGADGNFSENAQGLAHQAWLATTYRWHPQSAAPPVIGLVFVDWVAGVELFRGWIAERGQIDEDDALRVAIIEGEIEGQQLGYTVRISDAARPDDLGMVQRMHPHLGNAPGHLERFKQEYLLHGEFLLAPVVVRDDDQLYFNVNQGVIKRHLHLQHVDELRVGEADARALAASLAGT